MSKKNEKKKTKKKINLFKPIVIVAVVFITVLGLLYFFSSSSKKSSAEKACRENNRCIFNNQCGSGGVCNKKGNKIGTCRCSSLKNKKLDCPTFEAYKEPPRGCHYETKDTDSCTIKLLYCNEGRLCGEDNICGEGKTCYQPPMPKCEKGEVCLQVMPQEICKTDIAKKSCIPYIPYTAPSGCQWKPSPSKRKTTNLNSCDPLPMLFCEEWRDCSEDSICGVGKYCANNPMPLMPDCKDCPKISSVIPRMTCRIIEKTTRGSEGSGSIQIKEQAR